MKVAYTTKNGAIQLPEINLEDFWDDQVVVKLPVIAKEKKMVYIWKKSRNNKLVPSLEK